MQEKPENNNCFFFYEIGACKFGPKCNKNHVRPTISNTICLLNLVNASKLTNFQFDALYQDIYIEAKKYGKVKTLNISTNENNFLNGNVYITFDDNITARNCKNNFNTRWYNERPIYAEFTNFNEGICIHFDNNQNCNRKNDCTLLHRKFPSNRVKWECEQL